jgi:hypothetical protein
MGGGGLRPGKGGGVAEREAGNKAIRRLRWPGAHLLAAGFPTSTRMRSPHFELFDARDWNSAILSWNFVRLVSSPVLSWAARARASSSSVQCRASRLSPSSDRGSVLIPVSVAIPTMSSASEQTTFVIAHKVIRISRRPLR